MQRSTGSEEYEIFCFEASQNFDNIVKPLEDKLQELEPKAKEITFINKAVWTKNEDITFYDKGTESSSVFYRDQFINNPDVKEIKTPALDFSKWIQDNFSEDDHIILKLDIEGLNTKCLINCVKTELFHGLIKYMLKYMGLSVEKPIRIY